MTNTLKIGDNNLVLRDADAQAQITTLKEEFSNIGLSVVDGAINITIQEVSE